MRKFLFLILFLFGALILNAQSDVDYSKYFTGDRLRIDLYHSGSDSSDVYSLNAFKIESPWSGPVNHIISDMIHGIYLLKVKDVNDKLLYVHPYNSLFEEWQHTEEAITDTRVFEESLFIPYPKVPVEIELYKRNEDLSLRLIWSKSFIPDETLVEKSNLKADFVQLHGNKNVNGHIDIAFVADGYTDSEMDKFEKDATRLMNFFLKTAPFNEYNDAFNFYAVKAVSLESGTDIPGKNIWKETAVNSNFYTFGSERYLTTSSYFDCMDCLVNVPHDQVVILVNTEKYGGGGIFNFYSVVSVDHNMSNIVFTHEFGHAFGGLADEYYSSSTAYVTYPGMDHELLSPNVTNLVDFNSKWKSMVNDTTPIPTKDVAENNDIVGVYEGGQYLAKGIYRPYRNCRMKSNTAEFCPVCQRILSDMIKYYMDED
jgi:hypothetical protein